MFQQSVENQTHNGEHYRQILDGLHDILAILNSNRSLDDILRHILAQACRWLDATSGAVYLLDREADCLRLHVSQGLNPADEAVDLPIGWGAPGQAVLTRQPVAIADTSVAPSSPANPQLPAFAQEPLIL